VSYIIKNIFGSATLHLRITFVPVLHSQELIAPGASLEGFFFDSSTYRSIMGNDIAKSHATPMGSVRRNDFVVYQLVTPPGSMVVAMDARLLQICDPFRFVLITNLDLEK